MHCIIFVVPFPGKRTLALRGTAACFKVWVIVVAVVVTVLIAVVLGKDERFKSVFTSRGHSKHNL